MKPRLVWDWPLYFVPALLLPWPSEHWFDRRGDQSSLFYHSSNTTTCFLEHWALPSFFPFPGSFLPSSLAPLFTVQWRQLYFSGVFFFLTMWFHCCGREPRPVGVAVSLHCCLERKGPGFPAALTFMLSGWFGDPFSGLFSGWLFESVCTVAVSLPWPNWTLGFAWACSSIVSAIPGLWFYSFFFFLM